MNFTTPAQVKKFITQSDIRRTQSQKINNENWAEGKKMDQKIDDLFNKIKRVTSDWTTYMNSALTPIPENITRIPSTFRLKQQAPNPQRSPARSVSKTIILRKQSSNKLKRQISYTSTQSSMSHTSNNNRPSFSRIILPLPNRKTIQITDFKLGKSLGSGKFGQVYVCQHKTTNALFAIKKVIKGTIKELQMMDQFKQQLKIHSRLDHPNIPKMYTFFDDDYHMFMLLQYVQGKQLMEYRKKGQAFTSKVIFQVLQAVEYLHKNKIAHRDIKPENIILSNGVIKLCDFGWAANCENGMKKTFCGTMDYVSPEVLDHRQYYLEVDLWSIGILVFQLISGFAPFPDQTPRFKMDKFTMIQKLNLLFPPDFSEIAKDFILRLLRKNPQERMNIHQCYSHQFIRKYIEDKSPIFNDFCHFQ